MKNSSRSYSTTKGAPHPLGLSTSGSGINFAIFSRHARSANLCLFSPSNQEIMQEIEIRHKMGNIWHISVGNLSKHFLYGYKIDGQMVSDPYAYSIHGSTEWGVDGDYFPLGEYLESKDFDWERVNSPEIDLKDMIIYEMHVRGFTNHASSEVSHKGKFLGVIEKIPYLKELGVNAVKLLPIQEFNEKENPRKNPITGETLFNYWGYSTVNYFSPMRRYASEKSPDSSSTEFKTMVKELHRNGIAVILDIVLNHTAEGGEKGPAYSFKALDKDIYYILDHEGKFRSYTGCGNTVNSNHPIVMAFIIDCLRYWVVEMGVDGFRFDLASVFYRGTHGEPLRDPPLVEAISQDPVLAETILIAEPWDTMGMYQVGSFYPKEDRWSEWNGKYRDTIRRFIKGDNGVKREFAVRLCGSEDLYGKGRTPCSSINFVTAHDGFTLQDLVSYNTKHNEENGEKNEDGFSHNDSWNCGEEGLSDSPEIIALRKRQKRNFIVGLMVSQGVPMIQMGDEYGHTRKGNNNAWCQDNELNWFLWDKIDANKDFFRFYKMMIQLRHRCSLFRKGDFLTEEDITWHGIDPSTPDWDGDKQFLAFELIGPENVYVAFNVHDYALQIVLPDPPAHKKWHLIINTANTPPSDFFEDSEAPLVKDLQFKIEGHSSILLIAR